MRFEKGHKIDERFEVINLCSDSGGMGEILFVNDLSQPSAIKLVLKYCKKNDIDILKRFVREVRLMEKFKNNPKVVNVLHANTECSPPYFVMEYYENGDLSKIVKKLENNYPLQEATMNSMINCIQELHIEKIFHRDIKPANFLLNANNEIIVSDFGLGVEMESTTRDTTTKTAFGTEGYCPPEFHEGGFKHINATSDIYMLGKSFYNLLTNKEPTFLDKTLLHPAIGFIIEKACNPMVDKRFKNLQELKQAILLSYDVILKRGENIYSQSRKLLKEISDQNDLEKIIKLLQNLNLMYDEEQVAIVKELKYDFFDILAQEEMSEYLEKFLSIYQLMAEKNDYDYPFATIIAKNMHILFESNAVSDELKSITLDIAIMASLLKNRYDAMDLCKKMVYSISDDGLGSSVTPVFIKYKDTFTKDLNMTNCKCESIVNLIDVIQNSSS